MKRARPASAGVRSGVYSRSQAPKLFSRRNAFSARPPKWTRPWSAPARHERVVEGELVGGIDVDLEAELARERDARDPGRHRAEVEPADVEEAESLGRDVLVGQRGEDLARARAGEREARALGRDRPDGDAGWRQVVLEPAQVEALGGAGADDHEALGGEARDREVAHQLAARARASGRARGGPARGRRPASRRSSQASAPGPATSCLP